jgi:hypothetical protein
MDYECHHGECDCDTAFCQNCGCNVGKDCDWFTPDLIEPERLCSSCNKDFYGDEQ